MRDFKFFGGLAALLLFLVVSVPFTFAGLAVSPGTPSHTHSDANTGGSVLTPMDVTATGTVIASVFRSGISVPQYIWIESDAPAENKRWHFIANDGAFHLETVNDANTATNSVIRVERTGLVVDSITVGATLASTKACASGYTRVSPNLCWRGGTAFTAGTRDTCDTVTMPSSDAKAIVYLFRTEPRAANAVARRYTQMLAYDDATCVGTIMAFQDSSQYEEVAKVAGTQLGDMAAMQIAPVPTGTPRVKMQDDDGNQGVGWYRIIGYMD